MLWVIHQFSEVFAQQAVLKGGMALRLLDCPRSTTDVDYVFAPFRSKKEVLSGFRRALGELADADVRIETHSKMIRATVSLDGALIQVEANVAADCPSEPVSTGSLAIEQGQPPRIVRVMSPAVALSNKLAAWNERRLHRDLYDAYFLSTRAGAKVDLPSLRARLSSLDSRLPALRNTRSMTIREFAIALRAAAAALDSRTIDAELVPLLPSNELAGLTQRLRVAIVGIAEGLERADHDR